jgi:hypothetical protein
MLSEQTKVDFLHHEQQKYGYDFNDDKIKTLNDEYQQLEFKNEKVWVDYKSACPVECEANFTTNIIIYKIYSLG